MATKERKTRNGFGGRPPRDERGATRLAQAIHARGQSINRFARVIDAAEQRTHRITRGEEAPSLAMAYRIARALGLSIADLFGADGRAIRDEARVTGLVSDLESSVAELHRQLVRGAA